MAFFISYYLHPFKLRAVTKAGRGLLSLPVVVNKTQLSTEVLLATVVGLAVILLLVGITLIIVSVCFVKSHIHGHQSRASTMQQCNGNVCLPFHKPLQVYVLFY